MYDITVGLEIHIYVAQAVLDNHTGKQHSFVYRRKVQYGNIICISSQPIDFAPEIYVIGSAILEIIAQIIRLVKVIRSSDDINEISRHEQNIFEFLPDSHRRTPQCLLPSFSKRHTIYFGKSVFTKIL